jgi:ribose/xylose/arabinose/galactoside ABC-type transport system permease subunit
MTKLPVTAQQGREADAGLFKQLPLAQLILPAGIILLLIGFDVLDRRVLSSGNLLNLLQQTSFLAIFAMAQTIVILTRGFDLSLGPTASMVSVGAALAMTQIFGGGVSPVIIVVVGLLCAIALGAIVGACNGFVIALIGVGPFVTTLGSFNIVTGIATSLSGGHPVQGLPDLLSKLLCTGTVFGLPAPVIIALATGILLHLMLRRTVFGRCLYLIGTNPRAAAVAGISNRRILISAYVLSSALTALGAMVLTARTGSGEPNLGGSLSLQSVAAAVVGGVSLAGGSGGIGSAVLGTIFITILSNGMDLAQINGYAQMIILGVIIIAGVLLDRLRLRHD